MSNNDGSVPRESLPDSISGVVAVLGQHDRRLDDMGSLIIEIKASNGRIADGLLAIHDDLKEIKLGRAGDAGEKRALEGVKRAYVRPIIVAAAIAFLGGGSAYLIGGRTAPSEAQAKASEAADKLQASTAEAAARLERATEAQAARLEALMQQLVTASKNKGTQ